MREPDAVRVTAALPVPALEAAQKAADPGAALDCWQPNI